MEKKEDWYYNLFSKKEVWEVGEVFLSHWNKGKSPVPMEIYHVRGETFFARPLAGDSCPYPQLGFWTLNDIRKYARKLDPLLQIAYAFEVKNSELGPNQEI